MLPNCDKVDTYDPDERNLIFAQREPTLPDMANDVKIDNLQALKALENANCAGDLQDFVDDGNTTVDD